MSLIKAIRCSLFCKCVFQLKQDADELRKLLELAQRPKVTNVLIVELKKIESEISLKTEAENNTDKAPVAKPSQQRIPTVDIKNYGTPLLSHAHNIPR